VLVALWLSLVVSAYGVALVASPAAAQEVLPPAVQPFVEPAPFLFHGADSSPVEIRGVTRALAPRLSASYGLGLADETALSAEFLRHDQTLAFGTRSDGASRENWRHFLGLQYAPTDSVSLVGGIAKLGGVAGGKGASLSPTGYERLRFNSGAHWNWDGLGLEGWAADTSFSFIPTGANRVPSDAGFFPGMGNSSATWLFSFTVSRRF